ncbi:MAG: recombination-associated protein RdgC [Burkholderiales bacterium]|nr:recombination-associated protein RdgC [Burkholderiales bacterium]MDE1926714.1 recombination-associated protein RdgC [Burkholderiales bacterium]MDE2158690.1 recombination-associated protein RdgC [Burkholderiales bacterium]MDE2502266.1 recombination-associated protein RdgC [Burkholderiales bacterium]
MFKNALLYRIDHWDPETPARLEERLASQRFVACGASQPESVGWVEPRGDAHAALVEAVAGQIILKLCAETKAVPGAVVKEELERRLDRVEHETGHRPKGKRVRELKDEIVHELLPRAFPKRASTWVWIAPQAGLLVVAAASAKKADGVVTRLVELLGGDARFSALQTQVAPATAMAQWLTDQDAPAHFTIDRECELKQPDSEKAAVRYARHTLEIAEVGDHIRQGKLPTQLALTWSSRVSFVLTEGLALKKIKLLDVVMENAGPDDGGFDADVAIATGEMQLLIPDLVAALGGLLAGAAAAAASAASAAGDAQADAAPPWKVDAPLAA